MSHNSIFNPDLPLSAPGSRATSRGPSRATSVVPAHYETGSHGEGDGAPLPVEYSDDEYAAEGERIDEALAEAGRSDNEDYIEYDFSGSGSDSEHDHSQAWDHDSDEEDDGLPKQRRWGDVKDNWNSVEPFKLDIRAQDLEAHLDLGTHLMNAHLLKKMYPNRPSGKRKRGDLDGGDEGEEDEDEDEEETAKKRFFIRKSWTAWPLSADKVPREQEHHAKNTFFIRRHRRGGDSSRSQEKEKPPPPPSEMLYQVLVATVIRKANERIRAEGKKHLQPSDDDEMLNKIVGPAVRQMMGKCDQLLMALHHERAHYIEKLLPEEEGGLGKRKFARVKKDGGQELYQGEEEEGEEKEEKPWQKKAQTKKGKKFLSKEEFEKNRKVRVGLVGLRNWSHVLGEAALIGWDHDVLEETAKQCSGLFGEDMNFRTLGKMSKKHEGVMWSASEGLGKDVSRYKDEPEYLEPGFKNSKRKIKMLTEQRMLRKQICAAKRAARYAAEGRTLPEESVEQPDGNAGPTEPAENKESDGEDQDMDDDAGGDGNAMGAEDEFYVFSDEEEYENRDGDEDAE